MYKVDLAQRTGRFYADADEPLARKLARCFQQLEREPRRGNNIKPLKGELAGYLRYRIGDWRVIPDLRATQGRDYHRHRASKRSVRVMQRSATRTA